MIRTLSISKLTADSVILWENKKINADIFTILGILKTEHVKHIREKYYYKYCGILCWLKKQRCNRQAVILTVKTLADISCALTVAVSDKKDNR